MMFTDTFYQVQGAYGRKYNNLINAKRDWEAGLDFCMMNGHTYVNKSDHEKFGHNQKIKIHLGHGLWGDLA